MATSQVSRSPSRPTQPTVENSKIPPLVTLGTLAGTALAGVITIICPPAGAVAKIASLGLGVIFGGTGGILLNTYTKATVTGVKLSEQASNGLDALLEKGEKGIDELVETGKAVIKDGGKQIITQLKYSITTATALAAGLAFIYFNMTMCPKENPSSACQNIEVAGNTFIGLGGTSLLGLLWYTFKA